MNETITVAIDQEIMDLAERFLANRRDQKQEWRKAVVDGNLEALSRVGHELRGTAGAFGFQSLSDLAGEMEEALTDGDLTAAGYKVERMIDFLDHVTVVTR